MTAEKLSPGEGDALDMLREWAGNHFHKIPMPKGLTDAIAAIEAERARHAEEVEEIIHRWGAVNHRLKTRAEKAEAELALCRTRLGVAHDTVVSEAIRVSRLGESLRAETVERWTPVEDVETFDAEEYFCREGESTYPAVCYESGQWVFNESEDVDPTHILTRNGKALVVPPVTTDEEPKA